MSAGRSKKDTLKSGTYPYSIFILSLSTSAGNFLSNFSFHFLARTFSYFGQYFRFLSVFVVIAKEKIQCNCLTTFFHDECSKYSTTVSGYPYNQWGTVLEYTTLHKMKLSLCLLYTLYATFTFFMPPLHSLCLLYTPYASFSLIMPPLHSLCLFYTLYPSFTLLIPPLHSLCLLYTPYASFTLLMPHLPHLHSFTLLRPPSHSLCLFYTP